MLRSPDARRYGPHTCKKGSALGTKRGREGINKYLSGHKRVPGDRATSIDGGVGSADTVRTSKYHQRGEPKREKRKQQNMKDRKERVDTRGVPALPPSTIFAQSGNSARRRRWVVGGRWEEVGSPPPCEAAFLGFLFDLCGLGASLGTLYSAVLLQMDCRAGQLYGMKCKTRACACVNGGVARELPPHVPHTLGGSRAYCRPCVHFFRMNPIESPERFNVTFWCSSNLR